MSDAVVAGLIAAETAMIAALDADDIDALEAALPIFGESVKKMKPAGAWRQTPGIADRLRHALALAEAARVRVRYLADRNVRRMDLLATAAGRFDCTPATYGRP